MEGLTEKQKYYIRQVRNELLKEPSQENINEAYHWLYEFAGTLTDDPYKPWKGIE